MSKPRAWTQKEVQEKFLMYCWNMVVYWSEDTRTPGARDKLEGLMHSFLTLLDGMTLDFPAVELIPAPHRDDKGYNIIEGRNYFKPLQLPKVAITVHGNDILNDIMYDFGRKHGFCR